VGHANTARHWAFFIGILLGAAGVIGGVVYGVIAFVRAI
jgi:uncharacterized membrane protein